MSTLKVTNILSNTASTPPAVKDSAGTEIGTFCRAWVNFNGTGTVAIRASFNVSSITDNGTGDYTVNFTTALPDANYSANVTVGGTNANYQGITLDQSTARTTTALRVGSYYPTSGFNDSAYIGVSVFR